MNEAYRQRTKELKEKYGHMDAEERRERIAQLRPIILSPFMEQQIKRMEEEYRHLPTKEREEKIAELCRDAVEEYCANWQRPFHMIFEDAIELVQDPERFANLQAIADSYSENTCVIELALEYASVSLDEWENSCHFLRKKVFPNYEGGKYAGMPWTELNKEPHRKKERVLDLLGYAMCYAKENPQSYDYDEDMEYILGPRSAHHDPPDSGYWDRVEKIYPGFGKSST